MEGNAWLDGKGKPIPLDQPLVNHVHSISPIELWNSRCARKNIHPKDTPPRKGGAYNSTIIDKDTTHFNTPLSPIIETTINIPQSYGLSLKDTIVQDIMADPNIKPYLLQAAINTLSSRINTMMSAQAHQPVVVHLLTTRGQQLKTQTVTPANQIISLITNPNIPLQLYN